MERMLQEFLEKNPANGPWRKSLIEWTSWKRTHGVRIAFTVREGQELMDETDFTMLKKAKNWDIDSITAEWKALKARLPAEDKVGSGPALKMWIDANAKRFRDCTSYIDNELEEGSRAVKGMKANEREEMLEFVKRSNSAGFADQFFRGVLPAPGAAASSGSSAEGQAEVLVAGEAGKKSVEVVLAAPASMKIKMPCLGGSQMPWMKQPRRSRMRLSWRTHQATKLVMIVCSSPTRTLSPFVARP